MKIVTNKNSELTAKERSTCRSLSYRQDGDLQFWLTEQPDSDIVRVFEDDLLVGWGMKIPGGQTGYYVRHSHRRQGIGSKIYYTLNPPHSRRIVFPHNPSSASFFYAVGKITKRELSRYRDDTWNVKRKPRHEVMAVD